MKTKNPVWELSAAFEQWNAEQREHVVTVLENFGAPGYNEWPNRAAITRVGMPNMHASAMHNYVRLGQQGIKRQINRENMPIVQPFDAWPNESLFEVWFVAPSMGNTDNRTPSAWSLHAYITTVHHLVVIELGCNHTDHTCVRTANQYRRYECDTCGYTWGVDSSG